MAEKNSTKNTSKNAKKIGVLFSTSETPFYNGLLQGIRDQLELSGFDGEIVFEFTPFSAEAQCKKLFEFSQMGLSGLILTPIDNPEVQEHLLPFYDKKVPIITLNTDLPRSSRLAFVGCDNYKCGRASGELLSMMTGKKCEVAIITGSRDFIAHEQRISGFKDYIRENAPKIVIEDIIECKNDDYTAYDLTNRLLLAHPTLSALFFTAGGVVGACKALEQMTVPRNLSVVAFDVMESTKEYLKKGIISAALVQQPVDIGKKAMEILISYISTGIVSGSDEVTFPVTVMLREMV
ncbi:MAG: substrate-binding domain-containing protein [Lachnospiraceae bacterium]|nr:substrate-binding domain-containing protein [Lachnospiraceae bacterium]